MTPLGLRTRWDLSDQRRLQEMLLSDPDRQQGPQCPPDLPEKNRLGLLRPQGPQDPEDQEVLAQTDLLDPADRPHLKGLCQEGRLDPSLR